MKEIIKKTVKAFTFCTLLSAAFSVTGQVAYDIDDNDRLGKVNAATQEAVLMENTAHSYILASEVDQLPSIGKTCEYVRNPNACTAQLLNSYINENLSFPIESSKDGMFVKEVEFVVTEHGTMEDIVIISSRNGENCKTCDESIVELLSSMDNWIPGIKDDKIVSVKMTFPITFKIN